jgi:uncharacterized membrane protein YfcA
MLETIPWLMVWGLVVSGFLGGLIAGLFGVGGGLVMVPVFYSFFRYEGLYGESAIHASVATSLAVIVFSGLSSAWFHYKRGAVDMEVMKLWFFPILLGGVGGAWFASDLGGRDLTFFFALFILFLGVKMVRKGFGKTFFAVPEGLMLLFRDVRFLRSTVPFGIGFVSAMLGVGGGSMTVPTLTGYGKEMVRAVATSSTFGCVIAIPGVLTYMVTGWGREELNGYVHLGYVDVMGFLVVMPVSILSAPLGVWCAHRLSGEKLKLFFGLFLCFVGLRMLYAIFA